MFSYQNGIVRNHDQNLQTKPLFFENYASKNSCFKEEIISEILKFFEPRDNRYFPYLYCVNAAQVQLKKNCLTSHSSIRNGI